MVGRPPQARTGNRCSASVTINRELAVARPV